MAQSIINTTKIQTLVREIQQLDVAVSNFQTKYNSLPGDTTIFGNPGTDNDGIIGFVCVGPFRWNTHEEGHYFISDLITSGYAPKKTFLVDDGDHTTFTIPQLSFSKETRIYPTSYPSCAKSPPCGNEGCNNYLITDLPDGDSIYNLDTSTELPVFKVVDALALDKKSGASAGNVRSNTTTCISGGNYDLSQTGLKCELGIKMLSQTGQAQ